MDLIQGFFEIMSPLVVFKNYYYKFVFLKSVKLTKSCKNSTQSSLCALHAVSHDENICHNHSRLLKTGKWVLVHHQF